MIGQNFRQNTCNLKQVEIYIIVARPHSSQISCLFLFLLTGPIMSVTKQHISESFPSFVKLSLWTLSKCKQGQRQLLKQINDKLIEKESIYNNRKVFKLFLFALMSWNIICLSPFLKGFQSNLGSKIKDIHNLTFP